MTDIAAPLASPGTAHTDVRPKLDHAPNPLAIIAFLGVIAVTMLYVAYSLYADVSETGTKITTYLPYILLFVALLIALGFEFVNGFHDTANAVATVIYTHSLPANVAVVWSGLFNLLGVLAASVAALEQHHHLQLVVDHPVLEPDELALQAQEFLEVFVAIDALIRDAIEQPGKPVVVDLEFELFVDAVDHFLVDAVLQALTFFFWAHRIILVGDVSRPEMSRPTRSLRRGSPPPVRTGPFAPPASRPGPRGAPRHSGR